MKKRDQGNIYIYYFTYLLFYTYWSFYIVEMLQRINRVEMKFDRIEQKLDYLIASQKASMAVDEEPADFAFPFSSDEQFKEFERSLEGNEDKKKNW